MLRSNLKIYKLKAFTLVEVLIGSFLTLLVFLAISGAFLGALKIISQSRYRVTALALANQKIETIRNLPYQDVGTIGGIPSGTIPEIEIITRNNVKFTVKTTIIYIDDPFDGKAPNDPIPGDYKRVKIKVSWGERLKGEISLLTNIAPPGIEGEEKGGTLFISVLNANGQGVPQAKIHIINNNVFPKIDATYETNTEGFLILPGVPPSVESYEIKATKSGYSTDRTYSKEEVIFPEKPHATVLEGQLTEISFSIDKVSRFLVNTLAFYPLKQYFSDSFIDESKIFEKSNVVIKEGEVNLAKINDQYFREGYLISQTIEPPHLIKWEEFNYTEDTPPATKIRYQVLYFDGANWVLVPDRDLPGNSAGLSPPPISLERLDKDRYPAIRLKISFFSLGAQEKTPVLYDWQVSYEAVIPQKIANLKFQLRGTKIIGKDGENNPVYKYIKDHQTDSYGYLEIPNLEWDSYNFFVDKTETGFDLIETKPSQPVNLLPDSSLSVFLYLKTENTLLVEIKDKDTGNPVFGASIRLYNLSLDYDQTIPSDEEGKAFFMPLKRESYTLEIKKEEYKDLTKNILISGDVIESINLEKL